MTHSFFSRGRTMRPLLLALLSATAAIAQIVAPIEDGGTGAGTAAGARTNLGLGTASSPTFANLTLTGNLTASGGQFVGSANTTSSGGLGIKLGLIGGAISNATDAFIGVHNTGGPGLAAGDLLYVTRTTSGGGFAHRFFVENAGAATERFTIGLNGISTSGNLTVSGTGPHTMTGALSMTTSVGGGGAAGFPGFVSVGASGTIALPSTTGGGLFVDTSAPPIKRIFFGDGTGYSLALSTRSGSANTDRVTVSDSGNLAASGSVTATRYLTTGAVNETARWVPGAAGTYGASVYQQWFRADGTTPRFQIGYTSNDSQVFQISSVEAGGSIHLRAGGSTRVGEFATSGAKLLGSTTNDNAATGDVGEFLNATVGSGGAYSLTSGTVYSVTSVGLTPGDWDLEGSAVFTQAGGTTATDYIVGITNSLSAWDGGETSYARTGFLTSAATTLTGTMPAVKRRVSTSSSITYYLLVRGTFTGGTLTVYGNINARRVR